MAGKALYYPYIHIRDADWLKGTLLLFPQVRRMVPQQFTPLDGPEIQPFLRSYRGTPPLLYQANLFSDRAQEESKALATKLERDAKNPAFQRRYGCAAARKGLASTELGFQIHLGKLHQDLRRVLERRRLGWDPKTREPDRGAEYVEVHERVGQAIMSTLAIACAQHEGLSIVGDKRSGQLHRCLIEKDADAVYDAWLHPSPRRPKPRNVSEGELFEFVVGFACDLKKLTPERLATMREDREPVDDLLKRLRKHALGIGAMDPGREREERFKDATSDIVRKWREDRANMSKFWREFFGKGLVDKFAKFAEKVGESVVLGIGATASGAMISGAGVAATATAGAVGGSAGLAIGLAVHAGQSIRRIHRRERRSQYRYLTMMERAGAVFRSDLGRL